MRLTWQEVWTMKYSATKNHPGQPSADPERQNEDEGSRSATQTAKDTKHVVKSAKKAAKPLEGPQDDELLDAEGRAQKGPVAAR